MQIGQAARSQIGRSAKSIFRDLRLRHKAPERALWIHRKQSFLSFFHFGVPKIFLLKELYGRGMIWNGDVAGDGELACPFLELRIEWRQLIDIVPDCFQRIGDEFVG